MIIKRLVRRPKTPLGTIVYLQPERNQSCKYSQCWKIVVDWTNFRGKLKTRDYIHIKYITFTLFWHTFSYFPIFSSFPAKAAIILSP